MKYKEIYTLTRTDTSTPFFPEGSIHAPEGTGNDYTNTIAFRHFVETYVNTGKCDPTAPSLSDDGLTITYTTIYTTVEVITELKSDPLYAGSGDIDGPYHNEHQIVGTNDILPMTE